VAACFYINALTYFAILEALRRIRPRFGASHVDAAPFVARFKAGLHYVRERESAGYAITIVGLISFLGLPYFFLLPAIGRDVLGQGPERLGYLMGSVSVGALAGALLVTKVIERLGRDRTAGIASLAFWVCLIGFSLSRSYWLSVIHLIALGFALVLTVVAVNNLLQVLAEPTMRGRVMGLYGMALNGLAPLGGLLSGSLAEATSTTVAIGSMAAAGLTLTAIVVPKLLGASRAEVQYA
jgi:MFS family permease